MKIMYLCPRFVATTSGVETYLDNLISKFGNDHEIHLVTRLEKPTRKLYKYKNLIIHYIEGMDSTNINIYQALPQLRNVVYQVNPDLIHVHCVMSLFLLKSAIDTDQFPIVVTMHSTPDGYSRLFGWFNDYQTEIAFCKAVFKGLIVDALFFGSEYYKVQYLSVCPEMLESKQIIVNPYYSSLPGIDLKQRFTSSNEKDNHVRIIFPSRIMYRKGIEDVLEMLALLPEQYQLIIPSIKNIENQKYSDFILRKIESLGIKERIVLPNHQVFHDEMDYYYKQADVAIIPSHYEGFGIVAVEAMDYGIPVVSTCVNGLSEIITPDVNGLLVGVKDVIGMVNAIELLQKDVTLQRKLVVHGKETVTNMFSYYKHMRKVEEIYEKVIG